MFIRNLFALTVITLALAATSLGQENYGTKAKRAGVFPKTKIKANVNQKAKDKIKNNVPDVKGPNGGTNGSSSRTRKPKSKAFYAMVNGQAGGKSKKPRSRSKQKRQHMPCREGDCK